MWTTSYSGYSCELTLMASHFRHHFSVRLARRDLNGERARDERPWLRFFGMRQFVSSPPPPPPSHFMEILFPLMEAASSFALRLQFTWRHGHILSQSNLQKQIVAPTLIGQKLFTQQFGPGFDIASRKISILTEDDVTMSHTERSKISFSCNN